MTSSPTELAAADTPDDGTPPASPESAPQASALSDTLLAQTYHSLDQGDVPGARKLALVVLSQSRRDHDRHAEARALSCLAHCDRMVSRFRRAHDTGRRAAQLFQVLGDMAGESTALVTVAQSASSLGRNEEAVEAALLSVQLAELLPLCRQQALAYNYLGIAYFWSRSFERAAQAFEMSERLALGCVPAASAFQPRHNRMWSEAVRVVTERYQSGVLPDVTRMTDATEACGELVRRGDMAGLFPGIHVTAESMWRLASSLRYCWRNELDLAQAERDAALAWIEKYRTVTWLHALRYWVDTEIAWTRRDWGEAERAVTEMIAVSNRIEHEQTACLGHLIASQLFEQQGCHERALDELRRLNRREQKIRSESLDSRARVVKWQIDVRNTEESLHKLETASRQLERLSLEDPLTGLPNRRCFEQRLEEALAHAAETAQPLSLALIDVDKFKQVNDNYSHLVGDQVLKGIADVLRSQVRELDLPARLAGDEFVVLLPNTAEADATRVCSRISRAVEQFDWKAVAANLHVTISIGSAQAHDGDTAQTLLQRSDTAMYGVKHGRQR